MLHRSLHIFCYGGSGLCSDGILAMVCGSSQDHSSISKQSGCEIALAHGSRSGAMPFGALSPYLDLRCIIGLAIQPLWDAMLEAPCFQKHIASIVRVVCLQELFGWRCIAFAYGIVRSLCCSFWDTSIAVLCICVVYACLYACLATCELFYIFIIGCY